MRITGRVIVLCALLWPCAGLVAATSVDDLKQEVEKLRKQINERKAPGAPIGTVDTMVAGKYGPNATVTTKSGKLEIGGLFQIWNYSFDNDHIDAFGRRADTAGFPGTNETQDNNGYRIRRAELRFSMDIHENVAAVVLIDAARDAGSFPFLPSNQGLFKSKAFIAPEYDAANGPGLGDTSTVASVQNGSGTAGRLLKDAYVNFHGVVPHHDFTIGQFKPKIGEEGTRSAAYLDFGERAMVTQLIDVRDLGAEVHGKWWDDRVQYWLGVFDGAGDFFGTAGSQPQNRSDDNDYKDFMASAMVRPLWNQGCWGSMELGYSGQWGKHGESGTTDVVGAPINGLNRETTSAMRHYAWAMYKPMGPVRGWWLRGEWGYQKDRARPLAVNAFQLGGGDNGEQLNPNPFSRQGWYAATGYKLSDSIFAERLNGKGFWNKLMNPVEFAFRYEEFRNIITEDLNQPDTHTDTFKTAVLTLGVNYYIKAYNARVQVNYMIVDEHADKGTRDMEEVRNNVLLITYQIYF